MADQQYQQYRSMRDMLGMRQLMQQSAQDPAFQNGGQDPYIDAGNDPAANGQMGVDPNQPVSPENPAQDPAQQGAPDPMDVLPQVILGVMDYTMNLLKDNTLDKAPKSQMIQQQGDAIATLMKIMTDAKANQVDPAQQQQQMAELAMKQQAHEQDMQMQHEKHTTELQMAQEKHAMELQKAQADLQTKAVQAQATVHQANQKLQQTEDTHKQKLVHSEKESQAKIQQQKQAAQSKPSSKQGSNKPKKKKK